MSAFHVLAERLNERFCAAALDPERGDPPDRRLFEPRPANTLLRAACRLGVTRELEEMRAVQALPLGIQLGLRALVWHHLGSPQPGPIQWIWLPGPAHELRVCAGLRHLTVTLRSPPPPAD